MRLQAPATQHEGLRIAWTIPLLIGRFATLGPVRTCSWKLFAMTAQTLGVSRNSPTSRVDNLFPITISFCVGGIAGRDKDVHDGAAGTAHFASAGAMHRLQVDALTVVIKVVEKHIARNSNCTKTESASTCLRLLLHRTLATRLRRMLIPIIDDSASKSGLTSPCVVACKMCVCVDGQLLCTSANCSGPRHEPVARLVVSSTRLPHGAFIFFPSPQREQ